MLTAVDILAIIAALSLSLLWALVSDGAQKRNRHLPPGPKGLPIIGNFLQLPKDNEWEAFRDLGNIYGDVLTLKVPGATVLLLNSRRAITDLLESRASNYSDRPFNVMCGELVGLKDAIILSNNTARLRTCRKLLRKSLSPGVVQGFIPFLERQNAFFVEELLADPDSHLDVLKRNVARISMKIAYGYDGMSEDEPLFSVTVQANDYLSSTAVLGVWVVDSIPLLKHVPKWFPGAHFKRYAAKAKATVSECINRPFNEVKQHVTQGTAGASFCSMLLEKDTYSPEMENCIKWSAAGIFQGQMDTTSAALSWFLLAMALYPEVQAKAQAEIDGVLGSTDCLPQISDKDRLPYTMAVVREVFRWSPIVRLVPHAAASEDEYRGYFIPAKTYVVANIWAILHDEAVYRDAEKFIPERFLDEDVPDSLNVAFGFGRRVCPGMHIAQLHVFLTIATILSTLNIAKAKDASGYVIEPEVKGISGALTFPKPFKVSIQPRSDAAAELIRRSAEHSRSLPDKLESFKGTL